MARPLLASFPIGSPTATTLRAEAERAGLLVSVIGGFLHVFDAPAPTRQHRPTRTPGYRYRLPRATGEVGVQAAACDSYTLAACEHRQREHEVGYNDCALSRYVRAMVTCDEADRPHYDPNDP